MASSVTLRNLTKRYSTTVAVQDLTFAVEPGEFFSILGPSGAGKTSTLKMIAGLEQASGGAVLIDGQVVNHLEPSRRDVAMAFETYALYPHLSVFENMAFPLRSPSARPRLNRKDLTDRVERVAHMLQIHELLRRRPGQLSGGQRQRVALGRALVRQPRVFLMDEPIVHLDAKLRAHMRSELKQLHQQLGITSIYATPDWLEAMSMASRIAVIRKGVLQQLGTPDEIYNKPVNQFVADLVGDPPMNFFSVRIAEEAGAARARNAAMYVDLDAPTWAQLRSVMSSSDLLLGIRPAHVQVSEHDTPETPFPGKIFAIERVGRRTIIEARIDEHTLISKVPHAVELRIGDPVWVGFPGAQIYFFDPTSGRSLMKDRPGRARA
jgi:multiple sugar transport system ATP-binding protein